MNGLAVHPYNVLGICAGVGGLELGIHIARPGARGICYLERELYAAATLAARMEAGGLAPALIWDDVGSFDGRQLRGIVDCVASGDPCQPNSVAGKRAGSSDDRWLLDQVLRLVEECRPDRFFRENVAGNADGQIEALVPALERLGYRVAAGIFSAAEVGASHKRERLFIMADREGRGCRELGHAAQPRDRGHANGGDSGLADASSGARRMDPGQGGSSEAPSEPRGRGGALADNDSGNDQGRGRARRGRPQSANSGGALADAGCGLGEHERDSELIRSAQGEAQDARDLQRRAAGDRSAEAIGLGRNREGPMADAGGAGFQGGELERACDNERLGPDAHGSAAEFRGAFLFAPGPADCAWPIILKADPLLAPAIGQIDLWAIARGNLGLPPLVDAIGRRGGMVRDLDALTAAKVKSEVHRISNGLACRLDRLRACGNGVVPLAAAVAWLSLEHKLAQARGSAQALMRAA